MLFYFLLLLIISLDFLLEYVYTKNNEKIQNEKLKTILNFIFKYRILSVFAFVFMSTFKADSVGVDTRGYIEWFKTERYTSEIGYSTLQFIVFHLGFNYRFLWFIISLFVSISLVLFVNHFSDDKFLSLFLYVTLGIFAQSLNAMRQIISIAFIFLELIYIDKNDWIKALLMVFFATLFHMSGILGLVFIVLRFVNLNWITILSGAIIALVFPLILPILSKIASYVGLKDYYQLYFSGSGNGYVMQNSISERLYIGVLSLIFICTYIYFVKIIKLDKKTNKNPYYFLLLFFIVPLVQISGSLIDLRAVFNRISMYFFPSLLVLVPECLKYLKNNKKIYLTTYILCLIVALVFMYYLYIVKRSCGVFPYIMG